jgi:hypothetical protein
LLNNKLSLKSELVIVLQELIAKEKEALDRLVGITPPTLSWDLTSLYE